MKQVIIFQQQSTLQNTAQQVFQQDLCISLSELSSQTFSNLRRIIDEKRSILEKALPELELQDESIVFSRKAISAEELAVYEVFVEKLIQMAVRQKQFSRSQKKSEQPAGDKYLFRIWLNQLGMKGREYACARRFLSRNLTGSSAYSSEQKMAAYNRKRREARRSERKQKAQHFILL